MTTFIAFVVGLLVVDIVVKIWRLATGNTHYTMCAIAFDAVFAAGMAGWGLWVLASNT